MKIVSLGANLPSQYGSPAQTLSAAAEALKARGIVPVKASRLWRTAPVPYHPDYPDYINACLAVETNLGAHDLLKGLLSVEAAFGRVRTIKNAPRLIDLDLIAYDDFVIEDGPDLLVPHPRMQDRAFVLLPLQDIDRNWVHPQTGQGLDALISFLPADQKAVPEATEWCHV